MSDRIITTEVVTTDIFQDDDSDMLEESTPKTPTERVYKPGTRTKIGDPMTLIKLCFSGIVSEIVQLYTWEMMDVRRTSNIHAIAGLSVLCKNDIFNAVQNITDNKFFPGLIDKVNPRLLGFTSDFAEIIRKSAWFNDRKTKDWRSEIRTKIVTQYAHHRTNWCHLGPLSEYKSPDSIVRETMMRIRGKRLRQIYGIVKNHLMLLNGHMMFGGMFGKLRVDGIDAIKNAMVTPIPPNNKELILNARSRGYEDPGVYRMLKVRALMQREARVILIQPDDGGKSALKDLDEFLYKNPIAELLTQVPAEKAAVYSGEIFAEQTCIMFNQDVCRYIYDTPFNSDISVKSLS